MRESLRRLLGQVPAGRVTTFGRLATALGDVMAARWVADWLWNDPQAAGLPAHRVVLRDGSLGRSPEAAAVQQAVLAAEGIPVVQSRVDLAQYEFDAFESDRPLETLQQSQLDLSAEISLAAPSSLPELVAGVDLSYVSDWQAVAAYVLVEFSSRAVVWSTTVLCEVRFPYVTGYLSFREIPVHELSLAAAREAGRLPDVILVDGSGILHKRRAGVASHLGAVTGLRTIGVTKKFLCGEVDRDGMTAGESRPVTVDGEHCGWALQVRDTGDPLFVSPGHDCDVAYALNVVQHLLIGHKLPEPIWWADRLSRESARAIKTSLNEPTH